MGLQTLTFPYHQHRNRLLLAGTPSEKPPAICWKCCDWFDIGFLNCDVFVLVVQQMSMCSIILKKWCKKFFFVEDKDLFNLYRQLYGCRCIINRSIDQVSMEYYRLKHHLVKSLASCDIDPDPEYQIINHQQLWLGSWWLLDQTNLHSNCM